VSTPSQHRTRWVRIVGSLALVAALAVGLGYALPGLRLAEIGASLGRAQPLPVVAAGLAALSMHVLRAIFWRLALGSTRTVSLVHLFRYTIIGSASSALLPARAGEAVRVWLLAELEQIPAVTSIGTALAERALELVSMALVLSPLPWLLPAAPRWVTRSLGFLSLAGLGVVVAIAVLARRGATRAPAPGFWSRLAQALAPLSRPGRFVLSLSVLLTGWLVDLGALLLVARALGLVLPPAAPFLVLLSVNLAIAVPAAPAQLGSHEAGTLVALGLLHVPTADAVAFALLYHAAHVFPLLCAAALDAPLLIRALSRPAE
jgi:uncharacterized membrane protein YbhN (UPF0104 family)